MLKSIVVKTLFLSLLVLLHIESLSACSMYKLTVQGKTMVGNNEDSWGQDARIWFEKATKDKFGAIYVGYARKVLPDGGMNEYGLTFDAFTMPHKRNMPEKDPNKKDFGYAHMKVVMQQCKTVDEVYNFLSKLNLHVLNGSPIFNGGMFLFVDKTGRYLVVEAEQLIFGNDDKFLLANFSFADTKDVSTIKMERYCNGVTFLKNKELDTNLSFCEALSDTMSVNRAKVGDGTLYTTIYDLKEGLTHIYFYHDFTKSITFDLKEELAKGNHEFALAELFPGNKNFEKFLNYKTPQNSQGIFIFIITSGLLFFFSALYFVVNFIKTSNPNDKFLKLALAFLSSAFCVYTFILIRNQGIFYFPSPYEDGSSIIISMSSYLPFVLLLSIIPLFVYLIHIFRQKRWNGFSKWLFLTNDIVYTILIGLFFYWQLFDIFD